MVFAGILENIKWVKFDAVKKATLGKKYSQILIVIFGAVLRYLGWMWYNNNNLINIYNMFYHIPKKFEIIYNDICLKENLKKIMNFQLITLFTLNNNLFIF